MPIYAVVCIGIIVYYRYTYIAGEHGTHGGIIMMNTMTMEQLNNALRGKGKAMGRIMNKREMESIKNELLTVEEKVRQEMSNFEMIAKFTNTMTKEDVYSNTTTDVEYMEAEIVGTVGQGIEVGIAEEDRVDIGFYGTSYATEGIRYTDPLEPVLTW